MEALFEPPVKKDRRAFLGASDCAAVLGMSRWKTPLQVWAEKTGEIEPEDISDKLAVKLGNRLEEVVAELFMEKTGKRVHRVSERFVHKIHPFLSCEIDRKVEGERAILQCKTASVRKAKEWVGEEIPHEYILQEIHELAVTGYDRAYIAVLIGNEDFQIKIVERDESIQNDLVAREVRFWNEFIVPCVMPGIIKAEDSATLYKLFPEARQGEKADLDGKADAMLESLESMKQDLMHLKAAVDQQENEIKALLGACEVGESSRYFVSWKNQTRKAHEVKESTFRQFRCRKKEA